MTLKKIEYDFLFPHSPISMLQSVFAKPKDVLPVDFATLIGGRWGIVILVMIWGKIMQCFDCSKVFWPELFAFQEKKIEKDRL